MGLLDQFAGLGNLSEDQTQGLLAAAAQMLQASGPSRTPVGFGQIAGAGIGAYSAGSQASKQRRFEEEQARQMAAMRGLQMQEMQGVLGDKATARARAERLAQLNAGFGAQAQAPQAAAPVELGSVPMNSSMGEPQPAQAAPQSEYHQRMAYANYLRANGARDEGDAAAMDALKFMPKVDKWAEVRDNGRTLLKPYFEDGSSGAPVPADVAKELVFRDGGGTTDGIDSYTGAVKVRIGKTASISDRIAQSRLGFDRERFNYEKTNASSGEGILPPETLAVMAEQYLAGDTSVMQNLGRGSQGAQNIIRLRNEIASRAKGMGKGGADLAAQNAEYFGTKAGQRSAGTRIANVEMAVNEALNLIPLALESSNNVARSGLLPFGKAEMFLNKQTNDPAMREFVAANNALVNVYSRAISPTGQPTVSDKEHARELLQTAYDHKSYTATVKQMQREMEAARQAPQQVREAFTASVTGKGGHGSAPAGYSVKAPNGKTYTFPDAKSLANFKLSAGIK